MLRICCTAHSKSLTHESNRGHLDTRNAISVSSPIAPIPFLPGNLVNMQDVPQISQNPRPNVPTGSITILNTLMGTNNLLPNATFMITPNPYTLSNSLAVHDNDRMTDSSPVEGILILRNVRYSSYLINETRSPIGYGPVLLKSRISVHVTTKDPVVIVENRDLSKPFTGPAKVFAPYLNSSSFNTFITRGTTVGGKAITKVNDLPSTVIFATKPTKNDLYRLEHTLLPRVDFNHEFSLNLL